MYETIDRSNFMDKVLMGSRPVLLSCLYRDYDYQRNLGCLRLLAEKFQGKIEIYLLSGDCGFLWDELNIPGTPSFIGFKDRRETGRLFGRVLLEELEAFCGRMLSEKDNLEEPVVAGRRAAGQSLSREG